MVKKKLTSAYKPQRTKKEEKRKYETQYQLEIILVEMWRKVEHKKNYSTCCNILIYI